MYYFLLFLSGTILGSFLNVIIHRIPLGMSIVTPRSFCPRCKIKIPFYRNIPILSFLIQKGRCNNCKNNISYSYLIVEVITGLIFILSQSIYSIPESILFVLISSLLLCIAIIDYKYLIIPYQLSLSIILLILPYIVFYSNPLYHIYGMMIGLGYLLTIFLITWFITGKQPLGFGDIQLIVLLGLWLGPLKILLTIFVAASSGLLYWIVISLIKGYTKDKKLPFGTFLSLSTIPIYLIKLNWDLFR